MLKKRLGDADPQGGVPASLPPTPPLQAQLSTPCWVTGWVRWRGCLKAAGWPSACGGGPPQGCQLHTNGAAGCGPAAHPHPGQGSCHPPRGMCAQWPQQELGPGVG